MKNQTRTDPPITVGRGITYILIAAVAWGTGGAAAAVLYAGSGLGPVAVSFWRFTAGFLFLAVFRQVSRTRIAAPEEDPPRDRWRRAMTNGVGLAVYQTAYFAAVGHAGLAVATMVTLGSGPILIALGSRVWIGERLGRGAAVTVAMSLAGLILLVGGGGTPTSSAPTLGLACALLSATGYAGVTILDRKTRQDGTGSNPQATALGGFGFGMVCLLPLALIEGALPSSDDIGRTVGLVAYLGFGPTALAYSLYFAGLTSVRATTASVVALIEPVTAAVIAVLFLGERLSVTAVVGSGTLLAAVAALTFDERRISADPPGSPGAPDLPRPGPATPSRHS